jgi:hypothetical protein
MLFLVIPHYCKSGVVGWGVERVESSSRISLKESLVERREMDGV